MRKVSMATRDELVEALSRRNGMSGHEDMRRAQRLVDHADRVGTVPEYAPSIDDFLAGLRTAWQEGEVRPTAKPAEMPRRGRRRPAVRPVRSRAVANQPPAARAPANGVPKPLFRQAFAHAATKGQGGAMRGYTTWCSWCVRAGTDTAKPESATTTAACASRPGRNRGAVLESHRRDASAGRPTAAPFGGQ